MRILIIYPKMGHGGYSFFTGINIYGIDEMIGLTIGLLGFGIVLEYFYE